MAITKEVIVDKYEIVGEHKHLNVRQATVIKEDGKELSRSFMRRVIHCTDNISSESQEIQDITKAIWTDSLKESYKKTLEE